MKAKHKRPKPAHPTVPEVSRTAGANPSWIVGLALAAVAGIAWLMFAGKEQPITAPSGVGIVRSPQEQLPPSLANPSRPPVPASPNVSSNALPEKGGSLVDAINSANQMLAKGQAAEAVEVLKTAAQTNPEDEDLHYNLGIAYARLGKTQEALHEYEEALRIFPDYAEAHNNMGNVLLRLGRKDEAVKQFDEAVKIMPDYASAWNNYGNALQQLGRTNEALTYFQKAANLDTNYWQARFNLGTSYLQRGSNALARAEFEAVLRFQPDFAPAKAALARSEGAAPPSKPKEQPIPAVP